jgi:hypothetical protein
MHGRGMQEPLWASHPFAEWCDGPIEHIEVVADAHRQRPVELEDFAAWRECPVFNQLWARHEGVACASAA